MRLSDGERQILAELNRDARYTEHALAELADECGTFNEMLCELSDADLCPPWEWHDFGEGDGCGGDESIPY